MKKILAGLCLLMLTSVVNAKEIGFKIGPLKMALPFTSANAVFLYDVNNEPGRGLAGIETRIANFKKLDLVVGAVTDIKENGTPFVGLHFNLPKPVKVENIQFGAWYAYRFNATDEELLDNKSKEKRYHMFGVKASIPLW